MKKDPATGPAKERRRGDGARSARVPSGDQHLTSVLRAVRNVNQLITREKDGDTLLCRACEILTETRGYRSAWIGLKDAAGHMEVVAESGIGEAFAATRADLERVGWPACARQALASGEVTVLHDPHKNCVQCPLSHSYRDSAALAAALRHEGRDFGVLVVALPRAVADDDKERGLLAEVAGDLGFALHALELEARHRAAAAREAHIKQVLLAIRNVNQLIVHEGDPHRLIERACANLTETLGYHNAWIALLDGDSLIATTTASTGFDGQFEAMRERLARGEFSACARRALEQDATVVVDNPSAECADCPLSREYAGRAGFTQRLAFEGKTYGILAVSVPAFYAQDREERDLFAEVAGDLGFALHKIGMQAKLRDSEQRVHTKLNALLAPEGNIGTLEMADVIDVPALQGMMEKFLALTGIGVAILDTRGKVLVATGWLDICTKFHRVHPDTRRHCAESDAELATGIEPGAFKLYRCKNGLWDVATPIMLGGRHAGNLFFGQFFLEDETPDREAFRARARHCGFDEAAYLAALDRVPRFSRERVGQIMAFYTAFARQISDLSYGNVRLARSLAQHDELLARLGQNEERLRLALKATNDVVWDWDIVTDAQRWNETGAAVFGWTDIVEAPQTAAWWLDRVHPEDRDRVDAGFSAAVNDPAADRWRDEYRFRKADGAYADVADRGHILRDANGRAMRMIGAMLDITERKRAEGTLRESEARFRTYIEHSPYGVFVADGQGRYIDVNPTATRITGYSAEQLTSMRISDTLAPDSQAAGLAHFQQLVQTGVAVGEMAFRRADGSLGYWSVSATRIGPDRYLGFVEDITKRKEREERIAILGRMLDEAPVAVTIHNDEGRFLFSNRHNVLMHGYESEADFLGINLHQLDVPASEALLAERFRLIAERGAACFEVVHHRRDGSTVPLEVTAKTIEWQGQPAVLSIASDITERKRAEDVARESALRLSLATKAGGVGVWEYDIVHNWLQWEEQMYTLYGIDRDAFGGAYESWRAGVHPEDIARSDREVEMALRGEKEFNTEFRVVWPDGTVRHIRAMAMVLRDADGQPLRMIGTNWDITELKRAEQALRQSEERFRAANEASLDCILMLQSERDENGEIRDFVIADMNQRSEEMLRMSREHLLGRRLCETLPINREGGFFEKYKRVVETGVPLEEEFLLPETHVPAAWYYHQVVKVGDGVFICHRDIGDRKRAEQEREKLQAQLLQAQKMESVGRLAGGVAHDFNNLLMGIMNYAELCRDGIEPNHSIRQWLDEITHEAERSAGIVRQLLAFSRKQTIAPKVLDLNDAVANMLKMLRRLMGEDIDLAWEPGADLWQVRVDPGQIDQILANLCVNARDAFRANGKVTIETENVTIDAPHCAMHEYLKPGDFAMLAVSDDGCGMDRDTLKRIFEPFFTTKPTGEGTGLGLATVYGIVKQNDGFVNVYSEPGKGTTFRIYLPRFMGEADRRSEPRMTQERLGGNETLLLVEDEKSIRVTLRLFLEELGYTVWAAESPARALQLAAEHPAGIALLITDVVMPGLNGRELAGKLTETHPDLKVLYMSGYTANVIAHRGILEEDVQFVSKPINRDVLARKVREVLG